MQKAKATFGKAIKLKDVCKEITVGFVGSMAKEYVEEGIPFLRSQNILPFALNLDEIKYITPEFHKKLKKSSLSPGDVAVVRTGYPGTACVIPESLQLANCADLVIIRPSDELDAYYLTCIFNSTWGQGTVAGTLVGVAQQHFNVGAAKEMVIQLPPLAIQKRIASILSTYDRLIENNTRRIKILEDMAQLLYREWFVNFRFPGHQDVPLVESAIGLIPQGWKVGRLGEISIIISGYAFKSKDWQETGIPVIKIKNIQEDNTVNLQDTDFISPCIVTPNLKKFFLASGDFLVAMTGATAGKVGKLRTKIPVLLNQRVAKIEPLNTYKSYIWQIISSLEGQEIFYKLADGAAQPNMSASQIANVQLLIPPEHICRQFDEIVSSIHLQIDNAFFRNANLQETRDLLLPKLISGEIDVESLDAAIETEIGELAA
jgi:type I restriction enzyme, S subunit